jgi:hypothetical protein
VNESAKAAAQKPSRNRRRRAKSVDLWRPVPELDPPAPIVHAGDPATMLRSLGDPPMHGHSVTAGHYLAAVVERAAGLAVALAATADLLDHDDPAEDEDDD